jgi:hypothetical protein
MLKTPRALVLLALVWPAAAQTTPADQEQAARELISNAGRALAARHAAVFLEALDRPLADQLRKPVEALLQRYDVQPSVDFLSVTGDGPGVAVSFDWKLSLTTREGQRAVTHREKRAACRVEWRAGAPRITSFVGVFNAPAFLAPPDVDGAWDLLQSAARALSQPDSPSAGFLAAFDSKLPAYEVLRSGAETLAARGEVDSTIGLTSNEGTDTARTIEVDWTLEVVNSESRIRITQREAQLTFKIERRGKRWVIVSVTPLEFFQP